MPHMTLLRYASESAGLNGRRKSPDLEPITTRLLYGSSMKSGCQCLYTRGRPLEAGWSRRDTDLCSEAYDSRLFIRGPSGPSGPSMSIHVPVWSGTGLLEPGLVGCPLALASSVDCRRFCCTKVS
ncbi:hypothetical protein VFPPC_17396 [Pochonia chlamydosporia 170]|uniref:Uncharacterized protein n=1 Tax=Pochonia chlamydosporia 170 TaxID=1380566 RepID=A0A219ATE4_METCM|nr:hypothetical protein VFPPC_17396 [Pochonia chlamydosporia 170]OWT43455.1 hypothetical protein VFPPC_17396 [Pochonia chlamydosporia 170]